MKHAKSRNQNTVPKFLYANIFGIPCPVQVL
jgi:hypothetical protein